MPQETAELSILTGLRGAEIDPGEPSRWINESVRVIGEAVDEDALGISGGSSMTSSRSKLRVADGFRVEGRS